MFLFGTVQLRNLIKGGIILIECICSCSRRTAQGARRHCLAHGSRRLCHIFPPPPPSVLHAELRNSYFYCEASINKKSQTPTYFAILENSIKGLM